MAFGGLVYYVERILGRVRCASVTKSGKLIRCDTSEGPLYVPNSYSNRRCLNRHGFDL